MLCSKASQGMQGLAWHVVVCGVVQVMGRRAGSREYRAEGYVVNAKHRLRCDV